ncbi:hypothetical protein BGX26_012701 [Mortierella sp. AD094]|nr:hypothetical protein BGX26_012701 [Mortierella sp. AD094]
MKYQAHVSFLELHNDELIDLLQTPPFIIKEVREDGSGGSSLQGVLEQQVNSAQELLDRLQNGSSRRKTAATYKSPASSRSHAIFSVSLRQQRSEKIEGSQGLGCRSPKNLTSKLHFVDLAGSQRLKITRAEGGHAKEDISTISEFPSLGNVISALGDESRESSHLPYCDSRLTNLLQNSLCGSSFTLILACVSGANVDIKETTSTLLFANRARYRVDIGHGVEDSKSAEIARLRAENNHLKRENSELKTRMSGGMRSLPSPVRSPQGQVSGHHERPKRGNSDILFDCKGQVTGPPLVSTLPYTVMQPDDHRVAEKDRALESQALPMQNLSTDVGGQSQVSDSLQKTPPPAEEMIESFPDIEHIADSEHEGQNQHRRDSPQPQGRQSNPRNKQSARGASRIELYSATASLSVPQTIQLLPSSGSFPLGQSLSQICYASASSTSTLKRPAAHSGPSSDFSRRRKVSRNGFGGDAGSPSSDSDSLATTPQSMSSPHRHRLDEVPESSPLSSESPNPASQKKTKKTKKTRVKMTFAEKKRIIDYHEKNPDRTPAVIANIFNRPRTTVASIIEKKDTILAGGPSEFYRRVNPRNPKVEIAFAEWVEEQESRGIIIPRKNACIKAAEIHRAMLSCPSCGRGLRNCEYTSGWLKGFESRCRPLKKITNPPSQDDKDLWQGQIDQYVSKCKPEVIYYCYVTSMNLDAAPTRDPYNGDMAQSFASVLLCCNAAGTVLLDPVIGYRQVLSYTEGESSSEFDGLTSSNIEQWLMGLDARASERTLLLVDQSICYRITSIVLAKQLRYVMPIPVPESISQLLPMSTTLAKEFKALYKLCLLSTTPSQSQTLHEYRSDRINYAWHQIQESSIKRSVENSQQVVTGLLKGNTLQNTQPTRGAGGPSTVQPQKELKGKLPYQKHLPEYYSTQDGYTSPSIFICACVQEILRSDLEQPTTTTAESPPN